LGSGTAEADVVIFCLRVGYLKSCPTDDKTPMSNSNYWGSVISQAAEARASEFDNKLVPSRCGHDSDHVTHFLNSEASVVSLESEAKLFKFSMLVDNDEY